MVNQRLWVLPFVVVLVWFGYTPPALSQTLSLREAVDIAERNSPIASGARERVNEASARTRQAAAVLYPMARLTSSYSQSNNPVNVFMYALNQGEFELTPNLNDPETADDWQVSGQAGFRLFSGGRDWANRRAAQSAESGMRSVQAITVNELTMLTTRSYLQVLTAAEFVRSAEASLKSYTSSEQVIASRVDAGTALRTELLNIQVQKARAEERLLQAQNGYELAKEGLRLAMGLDGLPYTEFESLSGIVIPEPTTSTPEDRPEVLAQIAFANAARAELRAARSGFLPSVNAFASLDRHQGWEFDGDNSTWAAGLSLEWTLFDGFFTSGTVSEKRANLKAAEESARQARLQASFELRSASFNVSEASQRVGVMERAVELARESSELTSQRFVQGLALSSHVIDAEDALVQSEFGLAQARADRLLAVAALRRAMSLSIIGDPKS